MTAGQIIGLVLAAIYVIGCGVTSAVELREFGKDVQPDERVALIVGSLLWPAMLIAVLVIDAVESIKARRTRI